MALVVWRYNNGVAVDVENHVVGSKDPLARSCKAQDVRRRLPQIRACNRLTKIGAPKVSV